LTTAIRSQAVIVTQIEAKVKLWDIYDRILSGGEKFRELEKFVFSGIILVVVNEHECAILRAAEEISGEAVDCVGKAECNRATACVLVREHGGRDKLVQYFVGLANKTSRLGNEFLAAHDIPSPDP
jgi:hypothetical protein